MQPAAARVGPSNEPSVRRIAVRFSSGATICIEKTIKVLFFRSSSPRWTTRTPRRHRKKRANPRCEWRLPGKAHQNSGLGNQAGRTTARCDAPILRKFGEDSEISESIKRYRSRGGGFRNFYVADLLSLSIRASVAPLVGPVLAMQEFVGRLMGAKLGKTKDTLMFKKLLMTTALALPLAYSGAASAQTAAKKPNIVVIMADDVGIWNISAYHRGMMGGSTPNIDRIAKEGALFTDHYAQQSCTAGRAAFILGQTPFRTGLLKVGMPAAKQGLQDKDPTIAELLKPHGYATAQIGKNHLGDRNEYLPTVHGFDEFYGILYHLNAMEEPYDPDYPKVDGFH